MVDQSREVAKHDNQYKDEGLRKLKETVKALKECGLEEMVCGLMASTKRGKGDFPVKNHLYYQIRDLTCVFNFPIKEFFWTHRQTEISSHYKAGL